MPVTEHAPGRGSALLLTSSVGFGLLYFLTPLLAPMPELVLVSLRILTAVFCLFAFFLLTRSLRIVRDTWVYMCAKPLRFLGVAACGAILASQLWMFAYGPMNGKGMQVALGYFLLPLVLVLVGRFLYKDELTWWHWLSVFVAAAGVTFEVVRVGGFSWEALWVALLYPLYFVMRRALGTAHLGGMFWECATMFVPALIFFAAVGVSDSAFKQRPELWLFAPLVGLLGSAALVIWIVSSKLLPMSIFGLLSYFEPALLMLAAVLLGEKITPAELPVYIAVWIAVIIVVTGGSFTVLRSKRAARAQIRQQVNTDTGTISVQMQAAKGRPEDNLPVPATGSIPIITTEFLQQHRNGKSQ